MSRSGDERKTDDDVTPAARALQVRVQWFYHSGRARVEYDAENNLRLEESFRGACDEVTVSSPSVSTPHTVVLRPDGSSPLQWVGTPRFAVKGETGTHVSYQHK